MKRAATGATGAKAARAVAARTIDEDAAVSMGRVGREERNPSESLHSREPRFFLSLSLFSFFSFSLVS